MGDVTCNTFTLESIADNGLKEFFRKVLSEAYQQSIPEDTPLNPDEVFEALDQYREPPDCSSNGILNWNDYQQIISTDDFRQGVNVTFSEFARAAFFLENLRRPAGPLSPNYACDFSPDNWLRRPQIYPDDAYIVAYNSSLAQYPPRFQLRFSARENGDQYSMSFLRIQSIVDIVILEDGLVRLELYNNFMDHSVQKVTRTMEVSMDDILARDNGAALFMTESIRGVAANNANLLMHDGFSGYYRTFDVSDRLTGYLWDFVMGEAASPDPVCSEGPTETASIFQNTYPPSFESQPLQWVYQIFAIPPDVPAEDLPERITQYYNGDPVKAAASLKQYFLSDMFTILSRDYLEEEVEMIFQSSIVSPLTAETAPEELMSALIKADALLSVERDPRLSCYLYQLPRKLRNILLLYVFNDNPASITAARESINQRMNEALSFAARIMSRFEAKPQPKDIMIDVVNQVRVWFPQVNLHENTLNSLWAITGGPYDEESDRYDALSDGLTFLFETLHHGIYATRALEIIENLASQTQMTLDGSENGGGQLADFADKLIRGGFITAVTLPREDIYRLVEGQANGFWNVTEMRRFEGLPDALLIKRNLYLCSDLTIKDSYHTTLHELMHAIHNYGSLFNHLNYRDYRIGGEVKRNKMPEWLNEALAEYFAQSEMRRRGLDPGVDNFCTCKSGVFAIRSLIRSYGQELGDAFAAAHLSGDYTHVRDILNERGPEVFDGLMSNYDEDGVNALKWVESLDINVYYDDWR